MHHAEDSSHISQRLEIGRKALETLASIATQLENTKDGLIRSAYLTSNVDDLPPAIHRLWQSLDKDIMAMPAPELHAELLQLEQHLAVRLLWLTPFIEKLCAEETLSDDARIHDVRVQMQDMARLAGTALAIRILAHRKNYKFPPSELPVRADDLREKAQRVKKIERVHKLRVITHMREMVKATTSMLKNESMDVTMRTMLRSVLHDLQLNAKHLASGGSFASLPVPIEEVEMTEPELEAAELVLVEDKPADAVATQNPTTIGLTLNKAVDAIPPPVSVSPCAPSPSSSLLQSSPTVKPVPAAARSYTVRNIAPPVPAHARKFSWHFFKHLYVWVKSPMHVTWSEARLMIADEDDF